MRTGKYHLAARSSPIGRSALEQKELGEKAKDLERHER